MTEFTNPVRITLHVGNVIDRRRGEAAASVKFVKKEIADNKTIFLSAAEKDRMVAPEALNADIRRAMTRVFTKFKTGL